MPASDCIDLLNPAPLLVAVPPLIVVEGKMHLYVLFQRGPRSSPGLLSVSVMACGSHEEGSTALASGVPGRHAVGVTKDLPDVDVDVTCAVGDGAEGAGADKETEATGRVDVSAIRGERNRDETGRTEETAVGEEATAGKASASCGEKKKRAGERVRTARTQETKIKGT